MLAVPIQGYDDVSAGTQRCINPGGEGSPQAFVLRVGDYLRPSFQSEGAGPVG